MRVPRRTFCFYLIRVPYKVFQKCNEPRRTRRFMKKKPSYLSLCGTLFSWKSLKATSRAGYPVGDRHMFETILCKSIGYNLSGGRRVGQEPEISIRNRGYCLAASANASPRPDRPTRLRCSASKTRLWAAPSHALGGCRGCSGSASQGMSANR